jgi:uncharacterized protein (TIGR03067 family)
MMTCLPVTVLALVLGAPALKEPARPLLGQWVCTARTYNGRDSQLDPCMWEFAPGGKLYKRLRDLEPAELRYTADPAASPARLDLTDGEDTVEAIYKVTGDTLTLCFSNSRADDRPTRLESPGGSRLVLMTFKRVKD